MNWYKKAEAEIDGWVVEFEDGAAYLGKGYEKNKSATLPTLSDLAGAEIFEEEDWAHLATRPYEGHLSVRPVRIVDEVPVLASLETDESRVGLE